MQLMRFLVLLCLFSVSAMADSPRYIMLIGAPGTGKGTLGDKLSKTEGLPLITTSAVLKNLPDSDPLKAEIVDKMQSGELVPDALIYKAMAAELAKPKYSKGAIFDGFPRTQKQIEFLNDRKMQIEFVVVLYADDEILVKRLAGRRIHEPSGRVYHVDSMPPKNPGEDDVTGEPLVQRKDDNEWTIRKRLLDYRDQTQPVAVWAIFNQAATDGVVKRVVLVNASGSFEDTWSMMCSKLALESVKLKGCR